MVALGLGVIALILLSALFRGILAVAAAIVLTSNVALPGGVDVLVWIAAIGYTALCGIGAFVKLAALLKAGDARKASSISRLR